MSIGRAFERPNILLFLAAFTDSFVGQQIVKAAAFLRLNHRVVLPISHCLALLILQLSRLQTAGIQSLSITQLTLALPARSPILLNLSLNDPEVLEQTLQAMVIALLTLKDLTSCRSFKRGKQKSSNGT
jgi:hypothetical protein